MQKIYIKPEIQVVEIKMESLMQSISGESDPVKVNVYDDDEEEHSVFDAL